MNFVKSVVALMASLAMMAAQPAFAQAIVKGGVANAQVGAAATAVDGTSVIATQVGNQVLWVAPNASIATGVVLGQTAGVAAGTVGVTAAGVAATAVLFGTSLIWVNSATGTTGTKKS